MTAYDDLATVTEQLQETSVDIDSLPVTDAHDTTGDSVAAFAAEFVAPAEPAIDNSHLQGAAIKAYGKQTRKDREDKMILDFLPMVYKIVNKVVSYLHPPLSKDDLVSAGTIGLVKAARDFDTSRDVEFKTYAYIRVKGAVIDELRGWSFAPSSLKKQFDHAQEVLVELTEKNGVAPDDDQLAKALDMTTTKMYKMFENARARHFLSIHGLSDESPALGASLVSPDAEMPDDRMVFEEMKTQLAKAISELNEKQRKIVILYYTKELTMKEIATVLEITESRVSQLHASSMFKLSGKLKLYRDSI